MDFRLLGPLEVSEGRATARVGWRKATRAARRAAPECRRGGVDGSPDRRPRGRECAGQRAQQRPHLRLATAQAPRRRLPRDAWTRVRAGARARAARRPALRAPFRRGATASDGRESEEGGGSAALGAGALARATARGPGL